MANTDFSVLLKAVLDKSGINTELKQVQEIVKNIMENTCFTASIPIT